MAVTTTTERGPVATMPSDQVDAEFSHLMWTNFSGLDSGAINDAINFLTFVNILQAGLDPLTDTTEVGLGGIAKVTERKSVEAAGEDSSGLAAEGVAPRFIGNAAGDVLDTSRVTVPAGKAGYLVKDPRKAGIFAERLGFDEEGIESALRSHLTSNFGSSSSSVPMYNGVGEQIGTKFVVRGPMTGPSGRTFDITSSWGVDYDGTVRFITANPTN